MSKKSIITTKPPRGRAGLVGLALAGLITSGSVALAEPALASAPASAAVPVASVAPAVPAAPVELGAAAGRAVTSPGGIDNRDWSRTSIVKASAYDTSTVVQVKSSGTRIRLRPVTGTVLGLLPKGYWLTVSCEVRASDGYKWGKTRYGGRTAWVRSDLYFIVGFTGPGAQPNGPIGPC